jgi:hypothetical protein
MSWFGKNIISSQVINSKTEKIKKRALRDARKKIRKGELTDSHSFALYLETVDERYEFIKNDIAEATRVVNYAQTRANKIAETRQLLDFFSQDYAELIRLAQNVSKKAVEAGKSNDQKHERLSDIDLSKLKDSFKDLFKKRDDGNEKK